MNGITKSEEISQHRRRFFGTHPLAYGAAGEATMAAQLKVADLTALFRQLNVGGNVALAVAGDFDRKKLPAALKAAIVEAQAASVVKLGPWKL